MSVLTRLRRLEARANVNRGDFYFVTYNEGECPDAAFRAKYPDKPYPSCPEDIVVFIRYQKRPEDAPRNGTGSSRQL